MTSRQIPYLALLVLVALWLPKVAGQVKDQVSVDLPRGSILAWVPTEGSREPPQGWWVCDRETHQEHPWVPDLSGRFLVGANVPFASTSEAARPSDAGQVGGQAQHDHPGSRTPLEYAPPRKVERGGVASSEAARSSHRHSVKVAAESHLPPFYKVVYIIKG